MEQWWKRNRDVALRDCTKAEVEDFTGRIPLLLNMCVVNGKIDLRVQEVGSIWNDPALFMSGVRSNALPEAWEKYAPLP
jgi:hypothetical protein